MIGNTGELSVTGGRMKEGDPGNATYNPEKSINELLRSKLRGTNPKID